MIEREGGEGGREKAEEQKSRRTTGATLWIQGAPALWQQSQVCTRRRTRSQTIKSPSRVCADNRTHCPPPHIVQSSSSASQTRRLVDRILTGCVSSLLSRDTLTWSSRSYRWGILHLHSIHHPSACTHVPSWATENIISWRQVKNLMYRPHPNLCTYQPHAALSPMYWRCSLSLILFGKQMVPALMESETLSKSTDSLTLFPCHFSQRALREVWLSLASITLHTS